MTAVLWRTKNSSGPFCKMVASLVMRQGLCFPSGDAWHEIWSSNHNFDL